MSREERASRPYSGLRPSQQAFEHTVLQIGSDEVVANKGSVRVTEREFLNEPFAIRFGDDEESKNQMAEELTVAADCHGIDSDDLEIMVVAFSSYWKLTEKVLSLSLEEFSDLDDPKVTIATRRDRPRVLGFPSRQLRVEACCCLTRTIEKKPLRPHRRGTWLTKTTHKVGTGQDFAGFEPKRLDSAARERLQIPEYDLTQRYMDVLADPTDPATVEEDFGLYVDADLLNQLLDSSRTPGTSLIQRVLGMDIARAFIYRAAEAIKEGDKSLTDVQGSVFDMVLDAFSKDDNGVVSQDSKEKLFGNVRARPEIFVALVENTLGSSGFGKDLRDLAKGEE